MAHKKGAGASRNGRDSNPQHRGIKRYAGQSVTAGTIILRQCGCHHRPGFNVSLGKDFTIFSLIDGKVKFESRNRVSVYPEPATSEASN